MLFIIPLEPMSLHVHNVLTCAPYYLYNNKSPPVKQLHELHVKRYLSLSVYGIILLTLRYIYYGIK